MNAFWLRVFAPFAAFRAFQAGAYRSTSPVIPPSAAYGVVLNLAGIEMRALADGLTTGLTTEIRSDIPRLRIAVGVEMEPERASLYQQLHGHRVGKDDKATRLAAMTKGSKYWIVPVRRELLVDYQGIIGVQTDDTSLRARVEQGLTGALDTPRYGLPFAGDNNYLLDRVEVLNNPPANVLWYETFQPNSSPRKGTCRLTVGINRTNNSKTTSFLYAPTSELSDAVWTWTPAEPALTS